MFADSWFVEVLLRQMFFESSHSYFEILKGFFILFENILSQLFNFRIIFFKSKQTQTRKNLLKPPF